ncbi:hypothetical protein GCM10027082_13440 [Comamonas humi]
MHDTSLAVILLSRGAAYAAGETELAQLAERVQAAMAAQGMAPLRVQPAFVDRCQPALPEALDACAAAQAVVIVPMMVPDEPSLRRWLHKLVMRWRAGRTNCPRLVFAEPLLQAPRLADTLVHTVRQSLAAPDVPALVGDDTWERDPAGWSSVPEHQHHVLWCVGPRCAAKGSVQLWPGLARTVRETPGLRKRVMLLQTGCQYPCNHGPLMIVYPDSVWYGPLAEADLGRVLVQHVLHGEVDAALHVHGPRQVLQKQ